MDCIWCFKERRSEELSLSQIKNAFNKLNGVETIKLTGGEPFIRPDILEIISIASRKFENVIINSNGLLINSEVCKSMKKFNPKLSISLDGPQEVNDKIRGNGSFEKTVNKIKLLKENNFFVNIKMTVSKINFPYINEMITLAKGIKANKLTFVKMNAVGNGANCREWVLSKKQMQELCETMQYKIAEENEIKLDLIDPLFNTLNGRGEGCEATELSIYINSDGKIFPCAFLPLEIGNITSDKIQDVLNSPFLLKLRERKQYNEKCSRCDYWSVCKGCRAEAYACSGDYLDEDPCCWY